MFYVVYRTFLEKKSSDEEDDDEEEEDGMTCVLHGDFKRDTIKNQNLSKIKLTFN